jgi:hypothetical protein
MLWHLSDRANPRVRLLADRHYSRQSIGHPLFTPPGKCIVLATDAYNAYWITYIPYAQYALTHWTAGAWTCSAFRNEGSILSSTLIEQAVAVTLFILKTPPDLGFITFVNAYKIKSPNPGYCFKQADWNHVGFTKKGLHALQLLPAAFPHPVAPLETPSTSQHLYRLRKKPSSWKRTMSYGDGSKKIRISTDLPYAP